MSRAASLAAVAAVASVVAVGCGSSTRTELSAPPVSTPRPASPRALLATGAAARAAAQAEKLKRSRAQPYAIATVTVRLVDPNRTIDTGNGSERRSFDTIVRYPKAAAGQPGGPFPLIVFGHGFSVTPQPYSPLLDAWAKAGYVVAAPVFPLENSGAPGGPDEKDLVNQPGDMSLVISSLTSPSGGQTDRLAKLVDARRIAVTGQSDGGDTALAAAYDPRDHDPRIGAAMILSGQENPFAAQFSMPRLGPPLLAVQGTADTINAPDTTYSFYRQAAPPKFLLRLIGAGHQPPYTEPGPELTAVERTTIAFLAAVLKGQPGTLHRLLAAGTAGDDSQLTGSQ